MSEVSFVSRVEKGYRIFIPRAVREVLELREGDYVQVVIVRKVKEGGRIMRRPLEKT